MSSACPGLLPPAARYRPARRSALPSMRYPIPASMFCHRDFPHAIIDFAEARVRI